MNDNIILMAVIYGAIFLLLISIFIIKAKKTTVTSKNNSYEEFPVELDESLIYHLTFANDESKEPVKNYNNVFSSVILNLVRKGYIELSKIDEEKSLSFNNIKIVEKSFEAGLSNGLLVSNNFTDIDVTKDAEALTLTERYCYDFIMRYVQDREISLSDFCAKVSEDSNNAKEFAENIAGTIKSIGDKQGCFKNAETFELTQVGKSERNKCKKLYAFLNDGNLEKGRATLEIELAEKYLVYATLFGISEKVSKSLIKRCAESEKSVILNNDIYALNILLDAAKPFIEAMK